MVCKLSCVSLYTVCFPQGFRVGARNERGGCVTVHVCINVCTLMVDGASDGFEFSNSTPEQ